MEIVKKYIVMIVGAVVTLLTPIHKFMLAMLVLFTLNFVLGVLADIFKGRSWEWRKAVMFLWHCFIFYVTTCAIFVIGHLMGEVEQSVAVVKYICFIAIYIFGTNIAHNLQEITPAGTVWNRMFSLVYYVLSVKFIEKFGIIKHWQEGAHSQSPSSGKK